MTNKKIEFNYVIVKEITILLFKYTMAEQASDYDKKNQKELILTIEDLNKEIKLKNYELELLKQNINKEQLKLNQFAIDQQELIKNGKNLKANILWAEPKKCQGPAERVYKLVSGHIARESSENYYYKKPPKCENYAVECVSIMIGEDYKGSKLVNEYFCPLHIKEAKEVQEYNRQTIITNTYSGGYM